MDEQHERERLQEQCRRFSYYHSRLREGKGVPYRRALQGAQNMVLAGLLAMIQNDALDLLQTPEDAEEIGADILELLDLFSGEYANLLELEYKWYEDKNDPPER